MRTIKFRAWDKEDKKMYEVYHLCPQNIESGGIRLFKSKMHCDENLWQSLGSVELMQFTGLTDKNGKEIYEGDILETGNGLKFPVEWNIAWGCWMMAGLEPFITQCNNVYFDETKFGEVIGNIYENPELINNKEN